MSRTTLILRSLWYYRRTNAAAALTAAVATAVIVGALLVGDSVRGSLRTAALQRLGRIETALSIEGRYFPTDLSVHFQSPEDAPVLHLRGAATANNDRSRANGINVLGVGKGFWRLGGVDPPAIGADGVILNSDLAAQLGLARGEDVVLQITRPSLVPRSGPLGALGGDIVRVRLRVTDIVGPERFGRYSLRSNQVPPYNAFIPLGRLGGLAGIGQRANSLLVAGLSAPAAQKLLRSSFTILDAGLHLRRLPQGGIEMLSDEVFIDDSAVAAARTVDDHAATIVAYFVNTLRVGERSAPYSVVAAIEPPLPSPCPDDLRDDEVVINTDLAEDLAAEPGDPLTMTYYVLGVSQRLQEASRTFRIRQIVPISGPAADATLMPEVPGLTDVDDCRNWTSPDIRTDRIRPRDEAYWKKYRGTPKAFVTPTAARAMWANRYGAATAVRFPEATTANENALAEALARNMDPAAEGLVFAPVRQTALAAGQGATDFAGLFLGLSIFLIASAVLLTGLVFALGVEQRREQLGLLMAVGFRHRRAARLLAAEGVVVAVIGGLIGTAGGIAYTLAVLKGLSGVWSGAVASADLSFHATWGSLVFGGLTGTLVSAGTMLVALRRQGKLSCRELLGAVPRPMPVSKQRSRPAATTAVALALAAAALWLFAAREGLTAGNAFLAGCGTLVALLACVPAAVPAGRHLVWRNLRRRWGRSYAVIALTASATFLILAVAPFQKTLDENADTLPPGTGGFALYAESTTPLLDPPALSQSRSVLPMRLHAGDDASCLNLNRPQSPPILGVDPAAMAELATFTFAAAPEAYTDPWQALQGPAEDAVAAIADGATIQWALHSGLGETIGVRSDDGREVRLQFVAALDDSILQGKILIADEHFVRLFPADAGWRVFLVSATPAETASVSSELTQAYRDYGLSVEPAVHRLAAFNRVQNTYLSIFVVLGLLGLALGVVGVSGVVARNVLERRGELALMLAVGFPRRRIAVMVITEHAALLGAGLLIGLSGAIGPGLAAGVDRLAVTAATLVVGIGGAALAAVVAAAVLSMRGRLIDALRTE